MTRKPTPAKPPTVRVPGLCWWCDASLPPDPWRRVLVPMAGILRPVHDACAKVKAEAVRGRAS